MSYDLEPWDEALGDMDECIMSLYGLGRLLQSRTIGPAQLLPTLDATTSGLSARGRAIVARVEHAADALPASLDDPRRRVVGEMHRVASDLEQAFAGVASAGGAPRRGRGGGRKLPARRRLALERVTRSVGTELQAARLLVEQLAIAARPQRMRLRLPEVLTGSWRKRPAFGGVAHRVLVAATGLDFELEPRFIRAVVEQAVRSHAVRPAGPSTTAPLESVDLTPSLLLAAEVRDGRVEVTIGTITDAETSTFIAADLLLSPGTKVDAAVLAALAHHHQATVCETSATTRVSLAAA